VTRCRFDAADAPGEIAIIGGGKGPAKVTTGVRVIYADDRSWSYMTPEGHPWAAIITFSAHESPEAELSVAKVHLLVRANEPLYEASFKLYTSRLEDKIWTHTLTQVASHFGTDSPTVRMSVQLVDKKRQWSEMKNIWKNSAIRSLIRADRRG